jgi:arabinofuranan 3-O-arabinosyltransferase
MHWAGNSRTVKVAAGAPSLLAIPENFNVGWVARSDGRELTPIRVDGWQQGWLLPSSAAATIHLDFTPQTSFRWHLAVGLGLSGAVLLAGLFALFARRSRQPARAWPGPGSVSTPVGLAVAVLLGVFAGGIAVVGFVGGVLLCRTRLRWRALACVVLAVLSGALDVAGSSTWERSTAGLAAAVAVGILTGASLGEVRVRGGTADG